MKTLKKALSIVLMLALLATSVPAVLVTQVGAAMSDVVTDLAEEGSTPLWSYQAVDGGIELTKYNGTATDIYVPSTFGGKTVVALADGLFANNNSINSVTLGAGIRKIGARAFYNCDNLVCVLISEELTTIGDEAFADCAVFNSIILYEAVTSIGANAFANCPNVTVYCYTNSTAHTYAVANDIKHEFIDSSAKPDEYVQDGLRYYIFNGQAHVVGVDPNTTQTEFVIASHIKNLPVTQIYDSVFRGKSTVTCVSFPETIYAIPENAFNNCTSLLSVELSESIVSIGESAFYGCSALQTIDLPSGLKIIGSNAFSKCSSLTEVTFPQELTEVGSSAFSRCTSLQSLVVPSLVAEASYSFYECTNLTCVTIEDGAKKIGSFTFDGCTNLTSVVMPQYMENGTIGSSSFRNCYQLKDISIPDGVVSIASAAFAYCQSLASIVLPESVSKLEDSVFMWCSSLTEVRFLGNVSSVGSSLFDGCVALERIVFSDTQETIFANAFSTPLENLKEIVFGKNVKTIESAFKGSIGVLKVLIPKSVTQLSVDSFAGNTVLQVYNGSYAHRFAIENHLQYDVCDMDDENEIVVQDGVTYYLNAEGAVAIGFDGSASKVILPDTVCNKPLVAINSAFWNCAALKSVEIPDGVREIGEYSFYNCSNLVEVKLPDSVTELGAYAFYNCLSLTSVSLSSQLQTINAYTFYMCQKLSQVSFSGTLNEVKEYAFYRCETLYAWTLLNGVVTVGDYAFYQCETTWESVMPDSVEYIGQYAFAYSDFGYLTMSKNLKTIGKYAFYYCDEVKSLTIPGTVQSIGGCAFQWCYQLTTVEFEDGFAPTAMGTNLFYGCKRLNSVTFPGSIKSLTEKTWFSGCTDLEHVILGEGIETICSELFSKFAKITSVIVPSSVTTIYTDSFSSNTLLLVYENSYAHKYAVANSLLYLLYDGVNDPSVVVIDGVTYAVLKNEAYAIGYDGTVADLVMPDYVDGKPVTELRGTFYNTRALKSIVLPSTLKVIGKDSFRDCYGLNTEVVIPEGVTTIADRSFEWCSLTSVVIPSTVTYFGEWAFYYCQYLQKITLTEGLQVGGVRAFQGGNFSSITIPGSMKVIPEAMFKSCKYLKSITIGEGVETIEKEAFGYTPIVEITLPKSVKNVYGFGNCEKLESITIPGGEKIGGFIGCNALRQVICSDSVTTIDEMAFYQCTALETIVAPGVMDVCERAFWECTSLKTADFAPLKEIASYAFYGCSSLESVDFSDELSAFGAHAFNGCNSLSDIVIPDGVVTIPQCAFAGCSSLKNLIIPDSVVLIDEAAFSGCSSLENIIIGSGVKTIRQYAFLIYKLPFIYIPANVTLFQYSNSPFSDSTVLVVHKNSYAHNYAANNNLLYFVLTETQNPEINYGASIEGTVTYSNGTAVSGATVEIFYDDGTLKESVVSKEDGSYAFTYAEVGRYTVRATDAQGNTAVTQVSVKRLNVFDVYLAGDPDLILKKGWTVSGTLTQNNASVTLTDSQGNMIASVATENGTFSFAQIPNGTYTLLAEAASATVAQEITVFDSDLSDITLTFPTAVASIKGDVEVELRDKRHEKRNWVQVTLYNREGIAVRSEKTDHEGGYRFANLPLGEYTIVAETAEMRPDIKYGFQRSHTLTGYAYVNVTEATTYTADTIVLYEENDSRATISGKVTAHGEKQVCEVILRNCFRHEVARMTTGANGKYTFSNVRDGLYIVTAITESDGMGFAVVTVRDGTVYGDTDITVFKSDKIKEREDKFPYFNDKEHAKQNRQAIADEKRFYDSLSEKEKKQCSKEYVERLNRYCEWIAEVDYTASEGVTVENGGLVVSGNELEKADADISFHLVVNKTNGYGASADGIHNKNDHLYHEMNDKSHGEIKEYYEITMTKTVDGREVPIESVCKNTDASGKFRITLTIPETYRGHKHYTIMHEHHGEIVTLADLDDDPDTITVEIDKFSTFALAATDEVLIGEESGDELDFAGASLTLHDDLTVNYKVPAELFAEGGFSAPYVEIVFNGETFRLDAYTQDGEYYVFSFGGVLPNEMKDTIYATLHAIKDGEELYGATKEYSIATYCYNMLEEYCADEFAELRTLLVDILNYGAATQTYTKYNTHDLANDDLTDEQKAWATEEREYTSVKNETYKTVGNPVAKWTGMGLNLSETIAVRFEFEAETAKDLIAEITCGDESWTQTEFEQLCIDKYACYVRINAASMGKEITITLLEGETAVSNTVRYSIESYAKAYENDPNLSELVKAMIKYGDAAKAYVTECYGGL